MTEFLKKQLKEVYHPSDYVLTDSEFRAVYEWLDKEKDGLEFTLKQALLKLVNGEEKRRMGLFD